MAGTQSLGNLYEAAYKSVGLQSKTQRVTFNAMTTADAKDTDIDLPTGAVPVICTMKVIEGGDTASPLTLSIGTSASAAGLLAASSVLAAAVGTVYKGVGAYIGAGLATGDKVLLTAVATNGPSVARVVVDVEVAWFATGM